MARKEKIYHYIYKTINLLNGKYYYGMHSTDNLNDGYLGSGKRLKRSVNKHGKENHKVEILEFLIDRKELAKREKEIVNLNEIAKEDCMNLIIGGHGGGRFISTEHQIKCSIAGNKKLKELRENDKEFVENLRLKMKFTTSNAIKEGRLKTFCDNYSWLGKNHTEETKLKQHNAKINYGLGETNTQFGTCWIIKNNINKKIKKEDLKTYIEDGWVKGRKIKY